MVWVLAAIGVVVLSAVIAVGLVLRLRPRRSAGPLSIVMLRSSARVLSEADVRQAIRLGLGVEPQVDALPLPERAGTGFGVSMKEFPPLLVIAAARPYCGPEDVAKATSRMGDPEVRSAFADHKAWISVDVRGLSKMPRPEQRAMIYNRILGKVAARLMDDGCSLLYLPADDRMAKPGPKAEQMLAHERVPELFDDSDTHDRMVPTSSTDEQVMGAMEEARRRLPELVSGFRQKDEQGNALVKGKFETANGEVEYLWAKVQSVAQADGAGINAEIVNRAVNAGLPKRGEKVVIPRERVVDWMFVDEAGKQHGGFVEKIINKQA